MENNKYILFSEARVLYWLVRGKSLSEIAIINGYKQSTIYTTVSNLKLRFESTNLTQVVFILNKSIFSEYIFENKAFN